MSADKIQSLERMAAELSAKISELTAQKLSQMATIATEELATTSRKLDDSPVYTYALNGNAGDTAFMIICCALVLFMTIPGLGLYYGGMVSVKNVLATVMQAFSIVALITMMFMFFGYSLAFGPANPPDYLVGDPGHSSLFYGDASRFWYWGMNVNSVNFLAITIPESVYAVYQLTFAIITCALICGSFADRMKYSSMLVFMALWHIAVYCPIAHSMWHFDGFMWQAGNMDFAGGNVVHISSGFAGLVSTIMIGKRKGFGKERFEPHNILLTFIGASMLWVGWFGFNAGSAVAANALAGTAMLNTQISTSMAALTWMFTEWIVKKKPSVLGMLSGAIAGLVCITPACGWVDQTGAFFIGVMAGPWCYGWAQVKNYAGYDDALDAFGVHATGGVLGAVLTGFFSTSTVWGPFVVPPAPIRYEGVFYNMGNEDGHQGKTYYLLLISYCSCCIYCI
jgi:Amt family ammonium transporter